MKVLLVGDPHVTVEELADAQRLLDGVLDTANKYKPEHILFLGDQHHNHAVVRVEVTDFWLRNLRKLTEAGHKVVMLVGNHDRPNDLSSSAHALQPYEDLKNVKVIAEPAVHEGLFLLPYVHDKVEFQKAAYKLYDLSVKMGVSAPTLFCHQTFDGSKYENGFYAPDGADPAMVGFSQVVSGHIHTKQEVTSPACRVLYIGSPRWRTVSDANEEKSIVLLEDSKSHIEIKTEVWCSPIAKSVVSVDSDLQSLPFAHNDRTRYHIDALALSSDMEALIGKVRSKFPRAKIRPILIDAKKPSVVKESDGVFNALRRFVESSKAPHGTDAKVLQELIARRLNVN